MGAGRNFPLDLCDVLVSVHQSDLVFVRNTDIHPLKLRKESSMFDSARDRVIPFRLFWVAGAGIMLLVERIEQQRRGLTAGSVDLVSDHDCP
jgi:hypothetical protein